MTEQGLPVWLLACVGSVGITLIVATGKVFQPLREALTRHAATRWLGTLSSCAMCVGFWTGLGSGWCLGFRTLAELLWCAGAVSLASYTTDLALRRLGAGYDGSIAAVADGAPSVRESSSAAHTPPSIVRTRTALA